MFAKQLLPFHALVTYDLVCLKSLIDIATSAGLWASVATLWGAAGAWFTYVGNAIEFREKTYQGVLNLLSGIHTELEIAKGWAGGDENNPGYLQSKTIEQLTHEHPDWFNPSRMIFTFDTPTIQSITTSPFARDLTEIVPAIVRLNYSIRRLFDAHADLRNFVNQNPLYASVERKLAQSKKDVYTEQERDFMNILFGKNRFIHQMFIGGADSSDNVCLYRSYRVAEKAVSDFEGEFKRKPLPWWYWLLHAVAIFFIVVGFLQVVEATRAVGFRHLF